MAFTGSIVGAAGYLEIQKAMGEDGALRPLFDNLAYNVEGFRYMYWMSADNIRSHTFNRTTSRVTGTQKVFNKGYGVEYVNSDPIKVPISTKGMWVNLDAEVRRELGARYNEYKASQITVAGRQLMDNAMSDIVNASYGTDPTKFDGMKSLRSALDSSVYVIDAGGTGSDLTDIFIVKPGYEDFVCLYPSDTTFGLTIKEYTDDILNDGDDKRLDGDSTLVKLHYGCALHDERALIRIANVDVTDANFVFNSDWIINALNYTKNAGMGYVILCNPDVRGEMMKAARDSNSYSTATDPFGIRIEMIYNMPVATLDRQILPNTGSQIT